MGNKGHLYGQYSLLGLAKMGKELESLLSHFGKYSKWHKGGACWAPFLFHFVTIPDVWVCCYILFAL